MTQISNTVNFVVLDTKAKNHIVAKDETWGGIITKRNAMYKGDGSDKYRYTIRPRGQR